MDTKRVIGMLLVVGFGCEAAGSDGAFRVTPQHVAVGTTLSMSAADFCGGPDTLCSEGSIEDLRVEVLSGDSVFVVREHAVGVEPYAVLEALAPGEATLSATIRRSVGTRYTDTVVWTAAPLASVELLDVEFVEQRIYASPGDRVDSAFRLLDADGAVLRGIGLTVFAEGEGLAHYDRRIEVTVPETPGDAREVTSEFHETFWVEAVDPTMVVLEPPLDSSPLTVGGERREITAMTQVDGHGVHGDWPRFEVLTDATCRLQRVESTEGVRTYLAPRASGPCELRVGFIAARVESVFIDVVD